MLNLILFLVSINFGTSNASEAESICPAGKMQISSIGRTECCNKDKTPDGNQNCIRTGPFTMPGGGKPNRTIVEYKDDKRNGKVSEWDDNGLLRVSGSFDMNTPSGRWIVDSQKNGKAIITYVKGKLTEIEITQLGVKKKFSILPSKIPEPTLPVVGSIYPAVTFPTRLNQEVTNIPVYTLLYSDPQKKRVIGLVVNIAGGRSGGFHYGFLPNDVINSGIEGDGRWGNSPRWSVYAKVGNACQTLILGQFEEVRGQNFTNYYPWVECSDFKDVMYHFKRHTLFVHETADFYISPNGKVKVIEAPKSEDSDGFLAEIIDEKLISGVKWVEVSLSRENVKNFDRAWVKFYDGIEPTLTLITD